MIGIVLVSHSKKVAEGTCELAREMCSPELRLIAAGGLEDGTIGTDAARIATAIECADEGEGVLVLVDMGSAVLSAEMAIELLAVPVKVQIADAPFLEGAIVAAVEASAGNALEAVKEAEEGAKGYCKINKA